jgi:predicted RecA/RadA family phage recombinase
MKNFLNSGAVLALTALAAYASGEFVVIGKVVGVSAAAYDSGTVAQIQTKGVFTLPKATGVTFAEGDKVYWSASAGKVTTSGRLIGIAVEAGLTGDTELDVRLGDVDTSILTATGTLDFASIATTASADLTIAVPGAAVGDTVELGLPAAPAAGLGFLAFVSAADTVTVRAMNITGTGVDAASASYRVAVRSV